MQPQRPLTGCAKRSVYLSACSIVLNIPVFLIVYFVVYKSYFGYDFRGATDCRVQSVQTRRMGNSAVATPRCFQSYQLVVAEVSATLPDGSTVVGRACASPKAHMLSSSYVSGCGNDMLYPYSRQENLPPSWLCTPCKSSTECVALGDAWATNNATLSKCLVSHGVDNDMEFVVLGSSQYVPPEYYCLMVLCLLLGIVLPVVFLCAMTVVRSWSHNPRRRHRVPGLVVELVWGVQLLSSLSHNEVIERENVRRAAVDGSAVVVANVAAGDSAGGGAPDDFLHAAPHDYFGDVPAHDRSPLTTCRVAAYATREVALVAVWAALARVDVLDSTVLTVCFTLSWTQAALECFAVMLRTLRLRWPTEPLWLRFGTLPLLSAAPMVAWSTGCARRAPRARRALARRTYRLVTRQAVFLGVAGAVLWAGMPSGHVARPQPLALLAIVVWFAAAVAVLPVCTFPRLARPWAVRKQLRPKPTSGSYDVAAIQQDARNGNHAAGSVEV